MLTSGVRGHAGMIGSNTWTGHGGTPVIARDDDPAFPGMHGWVEMNQNTEMN
jgi:hypothetical protein